MSDQLCECCGKLIRDREIDESVSVDVLTLEMRDLLARASVVAEGPTQNFESEPTAHSKSSGNEPRGQGTSLYDRMLERFQVATTPAQRSRATAWASHELTKARRRPQHESTAEEGVYWAIQSVRGTGPMDYKRVAEQTGLSATQVWAIRKKLRVDPRTGEEKAA